MKVQKREQEHRHLQLQALEVHFLRLVGQQQEDLQVQEELFSKLHLKAAGEVKGDIVLSDAEVAEIAKIETVMEMSKEASWAEIKTEFDDATPENKECNSHRRDHET